MEDKKNIGYAFRIGAQTDDGITVDVTGNFPIGAPNDVINVELDKWVNIFSRQRGKTVLLAEQKLLRDEQNALDSARAQLQVLAEKEVLKRADELAATNLKQQIANYETRVKMREQSVASLTKLTI